MSGFQPGELIAVLPAAGHGRRLGLNAGSKELVAIQPSSEWSAGRPVIDYLLERIGLAGVRRAKIVIRAEKADIAQRLGDQRHGVDLEYLETDATPSAVHTVALALQSEPEDQPWLLGYPDILLTPTSALASLVAHFGDNDRNILLALFPSDRPDKTDMVDVDDRGDVRGIRIKQPCSGLRFTWSSACWGGDFTRHLLHRLATRETARQGRSQTPELFVGDFFLSALAAGFQIGSVQFPDGLALDVGTPGDLERARDSALF